MQPTVSIPNPIGWLAADAANDAFSSAMKAVWNFGGQLVAGLFSAIDKVSTPNIGSQPNDYGVLSTVQPVLRDAAVALSVLFLFLGIVYMVANGRRGVVELGAGIVKWVVANVVAFGVVQVCTAAMSEFTSAILTAGLHTDTWSGAIGRANFMESAVKVVSGPGLGLLAIIFVIPSTFGWFAEHMIRAIGIEILTAMLPVVFAGLLFPPTRRWSSRAIHWLLALEFMSPVMALIMVLGFSITTAAAGGTGGADGAIKAIVETVSACFFLAVSMVTPLFLVKLFAFVDSNYVHGGAHRIPGGGAGPARAGAEAAEATAGSIRGPGRSQPAGAHGQGVDGGTGSRDRGSGAGAHSGRFARLGAVGHQMANTAVSAARGGYNDAVQGAASRGAASLDTMGAGNYGGPPGGGGGPMHSPPSQGTAGGAGRDGAAGPTGSKGDPGQPGPAPNSSSAPRPAPTKAPNPVMPSMANAGGSKGGTS